jgi:hypothetical protein
MCYIERKAAGHIRRDGTLDKNYSNLGIKEVEFLLDHRLYRSWNVYLVKFKKENSKKVLNL